MLAYLSDKSTHQASAIIVCYISPEGETDYISERFDCVSDVYPRTLKAKASSISPASPQ